MAHKANHNVLISTQEQFLHSLREKTPEVIKAEWNKKLAKPETYPSKAFDDEETKAAKQPSAPRKNRYKSIECNDMNRIKVAGVGYFHGNAIKDSDGKKLFVATQGPTHGSMKDFWKVILQEQCDVIVMLCEVYEAAIEDGEEVIKEKSSCYWPVDAATPINFGDFQVNFKSAINRIYFTKEKRIQEVITKTRLEIVDTQSGKVIQSVFHIQHQSWPDLGVPQLTQPILDIYNEYVDPSVAKNSPVAVHCSAGIGRTGCFIAAYYCFYQFRKSQLVSVESSILTIRKMRGRAVQKATQYMFVHVLLLEMIEASTGKDLKTTKAKFVKLIEVIQSKEAAKTVKETKGKETKGKQQKKAGKGLKV